MIGGMVEALLWVREEVARFLAAYKAGRAAR